jgi:hypothetical protein
LPFLIASALASASAFMVVKAPTPFFFKSLNP